jgi:hypothetical protein
MRIPILKQSLHAALIDNVQLSYAKVTKYGRVPILVLIPPLKQSMHAAILDGAHLSYLKVNK